MWLQQHQRTINEMAQKMFVRLCREQLPYSGPVDIDGIVCISGGPDMSKKIVVKIHEKLDKAAPRGNSVTDPDLPHGRHSPCLTKTGTVYTDTPSPNLPKDSHRLQSPEMPQDDNNTLSMSLKIEADSMDSECSNPESEHLGENEHEQEVLHTSQASKMGRPFTSRRNAGSATVIKHKVMSSYLASSLKSPASSKMRAATSNDLLSTSNVSSSSSASKFANSALTPGSDKEGIPSRNKVPVTSGSMPYDGTTLSCKFCPETFQGFKPLQSHMEQVHRRYLCRQCLSTFSMRCNLRRHERLHQGLKPYRCDQCPKSFARSTDLKIHLNKHSSSPTPSSMQCKRCAKIFPSREMLSKHMHTVHKDQSVDLTCNAFQDSTQLKQHQSQLHGSCFMNGLRVSDCASDDSSEAAIDVARLQDSIVSPAKSQGKAGADDTQKVSSVLQQLLFTSADKSRQVHVRNIIHMDTDEDYPLQIDESAHYGDEDFPENENNNSKGLDQTCSGLHDDDLEQVEVASTSLLSPPAAKHASTPKKSRRKKGKPVRVICMDEGDDTEAAYLDDGYQLDGMVEAAEDVMESSLDSGLLHGQVGTPRRGSPFHSAPGSPRALDLSAPQPSAATSLSMLQQLIPNPELELQRENERTPPPRTMPVLMPKTEALDSWDVPLSMPILKPKADVANNNNDNNNAPSKPKAKKVGTPAPVDPDDLVEREYICQFEECGKKLPNFHKYDMHSVAVHHRYPCKLCRSTFTGRNNRTRHMRHHHGGGKSHVCGHCGKLFARSDSLREHQYIHTKSYHDQMCHNCGTRCEKKVLLLAHLKKCFGKARPGKGGTPKAESPLAIEQNKLAEAKQEATSLRK